jgi:hypothetical protein
MGCDHEIAHCNKTGRCAYHHDLLYGMQMKDGSIPRPHNRSTQRLADTRAKKKVAA